MTLTTEKRDGQIAIHIADVGIKPEDMDRIFEPFFSTKPAVKGTGLGLSVSYGIIKR
ncbi:MAG: ATP-binding protein, partial [Desulfobulbaceae bacterium]|nr:ATP-binding protein [Desulfobulbaceae bacterium]